MPTMTTSISVDRGTTNGLTDLKVRLKYKQSDKDDWTKVEDKALRKKIQNRLAKRKSRIAGPKVKTAKNIDLPAEATHSEETNDISGILEEATIAIENEGTGTDMIGSRSQTLSARSLVTFALLQDDVDTEIQSIFTTPGLAEHRYISLTEYSVFRAFVQNARLLAICPQAFADDDALSPWTIFNPYQELTPHDLSPTPLQLSTPHHPFIDIISSPSLRDNILLSVTTAEQEDRLCYDIHCGSFTIWGSQPWNAFTWEISQSFVTNWAWLVDIELIRYSNFWRAERGEGPLIMPDLSGGSSILGEIF